MFSHQSLILAIFRLPFSALRCQRELGKEQYALEAAAESAYCFEPNSLWHRSAENGNQRIARINDWWGISFYVFDLHGNPVSTGEKQTAYWKIRFICLFFKFILEKIQIWFFQNEFQKGHTNLKKGHTNLIFSVCIWSFYSTSLLKKNCLVM